MIGHQSSQRGLLIWYRCRSLSVYAEMYCVQLEKRAPVGKRIFWSGLYAEFPKFILMELSASRNTVSRFRLYLWTQETTIQPFSQHTCHSIVTQFLPHCYP